MDRSRHSGTYDMNSYRRGNRGVTGIPGRVAGIPGQQGGAKIWLRDSKGQHEARARAPPIATVFPATVCPRPRPARSRAHEPGFSRLANGPYEEWTPRAYRI